MAQRNDEMNGAAIGLALVGAAFLLLFMLVYAVVCFVAVVLTLVALCAWNEPLSLGKWSVSSEEARLFVLCGVVGLVVVPVFLVFCQLLFQFRIQMEWWPYILLGSYSFGALGLGAMAFQEEQQQEAASFISNPPALPPAQPTYQSLPAPPPEPFRFASWDDEDAR